MAQLVFGAVGAVVGSVIPGVGTSFGWMIGSAIGGALFPPKGTDTEGPRLGDLRVQSSAYGNAIPLVYGSARIAGNVIWSTESSNPLFAVLSCSGSLRPVNISSREAWTGTPISIESVGTRGVIV